MKKKNLIILLLIPFIISLLGIVTINVSINTFYGDITSIKWDYEDVEAFELSNSKYLLQATAYNANNAPLDNGNTLIWKVSNKDSTIEDPIAEIVYENENYYLKTNSTGEVTVTCSNLKGNIFRTMTAMIYKEGAIIVTPVISSSQNNIDSIIYYGEHDLVKGNKENAKFEFNIRCVPSQIASEILVKNKTSNIDVDLNKKIVTILDEGDASFTIGSPSLGVSEAVINFKVVDEGINVYTYDDLLYCTNNSKEGEIVVLRKSFESKEFMKQNESNNVEMFGHLSDKTNKFSFDDEVYRFETTFNQEYITQWNEFVKTDNKYSSLSNYLAAGLRVQKDFYGNGYTLNLHNLCYPSEVSRPEGYSFDIPTLGLNDIFRGPLPFYTLGDPYGLPLVTAFGQDNVGMYIDGDNITVNDVNIKNADLTGSMSFLDYTGTVVEVNGNNVTIKNSRLQNGKNVLRCFSTENFKLENSLLSNARNFLLEVGSDEYLAYDELSKYEFINEEGTIINNSISEYFNGKDSYGDKEMGKYLLGSFTDPEKMRNSLKSIQSAFNNQEAVKDIYKGNIIIEDTYFYNSGISAIALESMFNGPFLYKPGPEDVTNILSSMTIEGKSVIPYTPTKVGGTSFPVKVELVGKTKFYDYKDSSNLDITGLINENISVIAKEVFDKTAAINIDTIFPIKPLLLKQARSMGCTFSSDGVEYINVPIAFYGGGLNLSTVDISLLENKEQLGDNISINFLNEYMTPSDVGNIMSQMKEVMLKCVTIVTGFEPFEFVCVRGNGYWFDQTPDVQDLINNAKGV
ncbi:MAG: hypothetical protein E7177_03535 [Erysipelotrichaceae bacterium]|nr:hypothetical protein [Erysipelotrichaceae bacterium]